LVVAALLIAGVVTLVLGINHGLRLASQSQAGQWRADAAVAGASYADARAKVDSGAGSWVLHDSGTRLGIVMIGGAVVLGIAAMAQRQESATRPDEPDQQSDDS
jgi:threonine/homoserine/homoserine lactone efflux protein